jgi:two-component system, NtrC family, sensor kinase
MIPQGISLAVIIVLTAAIVTMALMCRRRSAKAREAQVQLARMESMAILGTMVASVTHDINTNLGVSISAISYLDDTIRDTQAKFNDGSLKKTDLERHFGIETESMEILTLNLRKAAELVASFKKISVYQSTGAFETFNLKEILRQVVISLTPKLRKTPFRVDILCDDALTVTGYPGAISQIMTNLINNALIHAFEGRKEGTITVSARREDDKIQLAVADDGTGMPDSVLSRAFTPFFTTKAKEGGTGLGLPIVKTIVTETLKGEIVCESAVGSGTRITITMPASLKKTTAQNASEETRNEKRQDKI